MKIVHIADYFQPKLGYQEPFLAREYAKAGHDVCVLTSDRYNPTLYFGKATEQVMSERIVGAGFFVEEGIKVFRLKPLFEIQLQVWMVGLEKRIRELNPDLVIMHNIVCFSALRVARLKKRVGNFKLIYTDSMTFANSLSRLKILYPLFKWLFSPLIQKSADALVAISPATRVFMHKRYGIPLERISIIPLAADDELFRFNAIARQEIRNQLHIKENDIVFIYTGRIVPYKRLHLLIEAAANLMTKHSNIRVMLVGGGSQSYIEQLKQDIRAKKLEARFAWHEAVPNEQLYRIYSAADVAVWPYGASIGMREAIACGLPIIIGERSNETEVIEYKNGLTYREEDVSDLAQQMEKLLDNQLRREMSRNSRKLVEDKLNWRIIAQQFVGLVGKEV